ncbi:GGDEF domain-containing protein [Catenovulum adriaticum]|uniref:diguanylate cyclase n=1 Tax=Catenovulum adriaticum TaxID=2984846 RepID=A0ABY7AQN2_9ALTE|nr:GGDEF domain-containing protein [Catenovulum sp. TS8]WAJ71849.1 GGDEF domain-containing protein [Catenovulum sp. TS8]
MDFLLLKRHLRLITLLLIGFVTLLAIVLSHASLKAIEPTDWLDVLGEGGIVVMTLVWIFFLLASRPPGSVTYLLTLGLSCFFSSGLLDLLDEFVTYPNEQSWLYWIESLPATIGMILMTWGLYQWHQEQLKLHKQLSRREAFYREHSQIDYLTQLYSADYMRAHLARLNQQATPYVLVMLDINNFAAFNRQYTIQDGDRLLREIADLIVMNLRQADLACRYAGDRFIIVMHHTDRAEADLLVEQIKNAVNHLAFKPLQTGKAVYHQVASSIIEVPTGCKVDQAISLANQQLEMDQVC